MALGLVLNAQGAWITNSGLNNDVFALTIHTNGHIVAGGLFAGKCAEWDGVSWTNNRRLNDAVSATTCNRGYFVVIRAISLPVLIAFETGLDIPSRFCTLFYVGYPP